MQKYSPLQQKEVDDYHIGHKKSPETCESTATYRHTLETLESERDSDMTWDRCDLTWDDRHDPQVLHCGAL